MKCMSIILLVVEGVRKECFTEGEVYRGNEFKTENGTTCLFWNQIHGWRPTNRQFSNYCTNATGMTYTILYLIAPIRPYRNILFEKSFSRSPAYNFIRFFQCLWRNFI